MATILSIEDDADLQQALGMALYGAGFDVHYAFNGKEGFDKVLALHPDLLLLDVMLPMMSGADILRSMRARPETRDVPVIVLTAIVDDENRLERELLDLGNVTYMRKPFQLRELVETIRRMLRAHPRRGEGAPPVAKGAIRLDPRCRTLWIHDRLVATLSPKRTLVAQALLEAPGPVKRRKLLERIWGKNAEPNTLEKTVQRLREDLGPAEGHRLVTTEDGYELVG